MPTLNENRRKNILLKFLKLKHFWWTIKEKLWVKRSCANVEWNRRKNIPLKEWNKKKDVNHLGKTLDQKITCQHWMKISAKTFFRVKKEEVFFTITIQDKLWIKKLCANIEWNSEQKYSSEIPQSEKLKYFWWEQLRKIFGSKDHLRMLNENVRKNIILKFLGPKKVTICDDKHLEKFWRFLQPRTKSICGWSLLLCHYYVLTPITRHFIKKMWKGKSKIMLKTKIHIKDLTISSY